MSGTEPTRLALRFIVHGRVQGVAFRESTRQEAIRLGVCGHVRNLADGTVAVHAEGPASAVEALVHWCHTGPPLARVTRVERESATPIDAVDFEVVRR